MIRLFIGIRRSMGLIFALLFLAAIFVPDALSSGKPVIAVLRSKAAKPYNDALAGLMDGLKESGHEVDFIYYDLKEARGRETEFLEEIRESEPDLFFTMGTEATLFAGKNLPDLPMVFTMVLNPVESGIINSSGLSKSNLTGVSLNIPIEVQFSKLREVIPGIKRIGMIYDAQKKLGMKNEAEAAAKRLGLQLVPKPVYSQREVLGALDEVTREADCLWAGVDALVHNPQSAENIILATLRKKLPFMVFSSHYVKAGALLALECDYYDIGRQSARIADKILNGREAGSIPVESPRKQRLVINERIIEVISLDISRRYLAESEEVIRVR